MDNLVNSLVTKTIGLTDQQIASNLSANPNMNDAQLGQFMERNGVSPEQMANVSKIPVGQLVSRIAATIPEGSAKLYGDTWVQPQYQVSGSGEDRQVGGIEAVQTYKTQGGINDKIPVGTDVQNYSPTGEFTGSAKTQKTESGFGKFLLGAAAMFGGAALAGLGEAGAAAGTGLGTGVSTGTGALTSGGTGLTAGSSLSGLTGGSSLSGLTGASLGATNALLGDAALGSTLANTATGLTGTALNSLGGAGGSLLNAGAGAATSALGTTLGQGLALNALGTGLGAIANQSGISDARDLINQYGTQAGTALNTAYGNAQNLNLANTTALGNNYQNLNTNLNNTLNAQAGLYDRGNATISNNAANQMNLLANTYAGQKDQAAANKTDLLNTYGNTLGNMQSLYNQQVGYQSPYQSVGQAGSASILQNLPYLNSQFSAADLNSQLAPNYAFQLQQGQMANQRAGNMSGGALGGNVLRGLQDYTQNYASGAYQNAFNNYQTQRNNIYNTLASMAGIGTTSAGQLASLGNTYGSNMGSLSSALGGNLTSNTGNLLNAGNAYGSNTSSVTNNLNNVLSSNLGQMQGAYNQYGSNLTGASNTYGGNLTTGAGQGINAANIYGANTANLAIGTANALASNATQTGANNATALNRLGDVALLGSMIKAT